MYHVFKRRAPELAQLFRDERGPLDGRDVKAVAREELTFHCVGNYHLSITNIQWDHELLKPSWWARLWPRKTTPQQQNDIIANQYIDKFVRPKVASLGRIIGTMHNIRYATPSSIGGRKIGAFQHIIHTDNVPFRITIEYLLEIQTGDYEWDAVSGDLVPVMRPGTRIIVDAFVCEARETCSV